MEAGLEVPFVAEEERRWDFGDQTPNVVAKQTSHAFEKPGRYVVKSFEGKALREQLTLVVSPRAAFHLVPPDVRFAVISRGLEDFGPAIDFGERLAGADSAQAWLDGAPLLNWAFEQASAGSSSVIDPREGLATFAWSDTEDARVSVVGINDSKKALELFEGWLAEHAWARVSVVQGLWRYEHEERALDVFVDRGALYAVETPVTHRLPSAQTRIAAASAQGLETDGTIATALDALPSGGLVLFSRAPEALSWRFLTAAVRISGDEARLEGKLHGPKPLWATQKLDESARFLRHAPEAPVLVASASLPPQELAALLLGTPGTPKRKELEAELLELSVYADVPGFVRATLESGGKPQPQGTVLFEAPVTADAALEGFVDALARRWELELTKAREKQLRVWRGLLSARLFEVALTQHSLYAKLGSPIEGREPADLSQLLSKRYDGAFGPGHVSVFLDVGQLRKELLFPRQLAGVDPRRALTAQALAATILDQLTQLDSALVDLAPAAEGAQVQAVLRLRPAPSAP